MSSLSPLGVPGVALVTGGGSGIGRATSLLLAKEGVRALTIADINNAHGETVKAEAEKAATNPDFKCIVLATDVTDHEAVQVMVAETVKAFGRLDYAVNCAGIGFKRPFNDTAISDWQRVININLTAVFSCVNAEANQMIKQTPLQSESASQPLQSGAIVNIASLAALVGIRNSGAYTAAKHGVVGITQTYALDHPEVKINAIVPGWIKTPLTDAPGEMRDNAIDKANNWTPMKRFGQPEEIAQGIVWLLGSRSNFCHGSCLTMDGGFLCQ